MRKGHFSANVLRTRLCLPSNFTHCEVYPVPILRVCFVYSENMVNKHGRREQRPTTPTLLLHSPDIKYIAAIFRDENSNTFYVFITTFSAKILVARMRKGRLQMEKRYTFQFQHFAFYDLSVPVRGDSIYRSRHLAQNSNSHNFSFTKLDCFTMPFCPIADCV